ncbi:MAG: hypothetical protein U1A78_10155 [Polyangia bacterium]
MPHSPSSQPLRSSLKDRIRHHARRNARLVRRLGPAAVLAGLWLVIPAVTALWMVASIGRLSDFLHSLPMHGVFIWTPLIGVCVGLGLLAIYANTMLCGWVFGWGGGFVSALTSYLIGLCIGYAITRRVSAPTVNTLLEEHEPAALLRRALLHSSPRRALLVVTLFRLAGFPFPFGTLVLTSLGVPLGRQIFAALIGLLPRVGTATWIAATAAGTGARDLQSLVRADSQPVQLLVGVGLSLVVVAALGLIARNAIKRIAETTPPPALVDVSAVNAAGHASPEPPRAEP